MPYKSKRGTSLKFFIPFVLFITAIILLSIETLVQADREYKEMYKSAGVKAKVIGNRLASQISRESKGIGVNHQHVVSSVASYMADGLDQVEMYDANLKRIFTRTVPTYNQANVNIDKSMAKKVIKNQFSHIVYDKEGQHILGYFPVDFIELHDKAMLYLVFDISSDYNNAQKRITNNTLMTVSIVCVMLITLFLLSYFLIFRRLDTLHKATKELSDGNFNVHIINRGNDELAEVIETFNIMAKQMNLYKHEMNEQVQKGILEHTEQGKMLIQQSRLASMGEMIGNIAHQWRQPLNALGLIIQKLDIFAQRGKLSPKVMFENAKKATLIINKMSTTIDDFRDFFKPDKEKEYFNVKMMFTEVMELMQAGLDHYHIKVDMQIAPFCEIYGFKNEFSQVIVNLLNNSRDALVDGDIENPEIVIILTEVNHQITLSISDNAGGIDESIIHRIFEPYYTTKEEGKGTGIGLHMSKMIVEENMHGFIGVKNDLLGAKFTMIFTNKEEER